MKIRVEDVLQYHSTGKRGKVEVVPTKPCMTQRDLSLAYTPGVAEVCRVIDKEADAAYEYTSKGNQSRRAVIITVDEQIPCMMPPVPCSRFAGFDRFITISSSRD